MDETDHRHVAVEDDTGGRSNCETRRGSGSEVDDRSGETGTISRDQKKVL